MIDAADAYGLAAVNFILIPVAALAAVVMTVGAVQAFDPLHPRRSLRWAVLSLGPAAGFVSINFLLVAGSIIGEPLRWTDLLVSMYVIVLLAFLIQGLAMSVASMVWAIRLFARRRHRMPPQRRPQAS